MIPQIQLIQVTTDELTSLIKEAVKEQFKDLSSQIDGIDLKPQKEFVTRKETQTMFGISSGTINDWQNNGTLKLYKMGNRSYFKYSEMLETLYKSNRS